MADKTFTNPLTLKTDTRITADRILESIEILRFQGLVPHQIKFGMVDKCPGCSEPTWGLFMAEDEGVEIEEGEPLGICLQCNATIFVDENGKPNARIISSQDLLRGLRIGKGK